MISVEHNVYTSSKVKSAFVHGSDSFWQKWG